MQRTARTQSVCGVIVEMDKKLMSGPFCRGHVMIPVCQHSGWMSVSVCGVYAGGNRSDLEGVLLLASSQQYCPYGTSKLNHLINSWSDS